MIPLEEYYDDGYSLGSARGGRPMARGGAQGRGPKTIPSLLDMTSGRRPPPLPMMYQEEEEIEDYGGFIHGGSGGRLGPMIGALRPGGRGRFPPDSRRHPEAVPRPKSMASMVESLLSEAGYPELQSSRLARPSARPDDDLPLGWRREPQMGGGGGVRPSMLGNVELGGGYSRSMVHDDVNIKESMAHSLLKGITSYVSPLGGGGSRSAPQGPPFKRPLLGDAYDPYHSVSSEASIPEALLTCLLIILPQLNSIEFFGCT